MNSLLSLSVPVLIAAVALYAMLKKVDLFGSLITGAAQGLVTIKNIVPALIMLLTGIHMLRASGALELATQALTPLFSLLGIPSELAPLVLLRPLSGSGSLAVGADLIATYGADSLLGRTAAVMLGSTETTLYVAGIYFGAVGVSRTRYALPVSLCADAFSFVAAAWICQRLWG